ncbi:Receptor-type guanylate cyclase gcy [Seminavis robusta]|uniref:Receptor-type guanylate cyclase gcy n=1 Tax=Seminavis robusta TaxID=568900 RepID=A0A9N8HNI4_9STRA|nr:Receptor-type guanylate cyclase gcy [Seminavis robusta]|eukprot:Sro997_g229450.1 Receptor-type guanylate cyclase gcy (757) ;mRNA; r:24273-27455
MPKPEPTATTTMPWGSNSSRNNQEDYDDEDAMSEVYSTVHGNEESAELKTAKQKKEEEAMLVQATQENKAVWMFRMLTTLVLVAVAVAVCLVVALNEKNNEKKDFETAFQELGGQLVTTFESHVVQRKGIIDNFSMELTSDCKNDLNCTWPFFTPNDFERRAKMTSELATITQLFLLPRVYSELEEVWVEYTQEKQGWIVDSLKAQGREEPIEASPVPPFVYKTVGGKPIPMNASLWDQYFPVWMQFPAATMTFVNYNIYGSTEVGKLQIDAVYETGMPSFPRSVNFWDESTHESVVYQLIKLMSPEYNGDPFYTGYSPVWSSLDPNDETREIVAVLVIGVVWNTYFQSVLPEGTKDITVILENQCNQTFTYSVGGKTGEFQGFEDFHDPKYDYLELGSNINDVIGIDRDQFTLNGGNCDYSIRVYPSKEFEESFYTNRATVYALALAFVFVFTCSVFLLYDRMVELRQKKVMKAALRSGKLVSSLFPEEVRNRLYEEEEAKKKAVEPGWKSMKASERQSQSHAIATLYPETTIFFADLAGFTKWSSSRTPVEVFDLLETVYGEFDKLAKRYKVFKVETIGDCYVAVTGLPKPQEDHVVLMVKFARSCMAKFQLLTLDLSETLGEDTKSLEMRVGLHSGPVTAGVLRGDKGRFQLFGDSVNTASRMESNGVKAKIHCSEATAEALRKAGKTNWLLPREDKIVAKGKGEMQTYFVEVKGLAATSTSGSALSSVSIRNLSASGVEGSGAQDSQSDIEV